jgi:electron transport complex protein RnfC
VGDYVKLGQVIGESEGFVSAPVHASVSGKVVAVGRFSHASGVDQPAVAIESDGLDQWCESSAQPDLKALSAEAIREIARKAGIVGLGGATFPSHVKLSPPPDKPIDTLIVNGCECEPYLTADHRLMLERSEAVVYGLCAMALAVGAKKAFIAIEDNKPDAIIAMRAALEEARKLPHGFVLADIGATVQALPTKYPQGAEKQLIWAVTGRAVPSGKLPMEVGCLVHNVGTAVALADAFRLGQPLIERLVTVTGSIVNNPGNYLVRLGTPVSEVLAHAGGLTGEIGKLVLGGPMMGLAQVSDSVPVTKGTSGILVLNVAEAKLPTSGPCIRCARCIQACPMFLQPLYLGKFADRGFWEEADKAGVKDCIECGSCAFVCPAKIPLVQKIRLVKASIAAASSQAKAAAK